MTSLTKNRIESIDLLKGLVMIIMALDHTRDYFHSSAFYFSPDDPISTSLPIFLTRWVTHFCAPAFSILAGLSAFMVGKRKTRNELSGYLFKRGLWLIFIEITIVSFGWTFDVGLHQLFLQTIWSLGASMLVLAGLIYLPKKHIIIFSCLLIFGHNIFDNVHFKDSIIWSMLHEYNSFYFFNDHAFTTAYPLIPWIAVMSLGYCFGTFYEKSYDNKKRKKIFNIIGIISLLLFFFLRWLNIYGDPFPWNHYDSFKQNFISFMNPSKYPPSLLFLLLTLGATLLFLANSENLKGKIVNFFTMFGRVPFFFYIIHIYLIHLVALLTAEFTGFGGDHMILRGWVTTVSSLKGYGFNLWAVYLIWIGLVFSLYPLCKMFDNYKLNNKNKWWLSYF